MSLVTSDECFTFQLEKNPHPSLDIQKIIVSLQRKQRMIHHKTHSIERKKIFFMEILLMPVPGLQERYSNVFSETHEYQRRRE